MCGGSATACCVGLLGTSRATHAYTRLCGLSTADVALRLPAGWWTGPCQNDTCLHSSVVHVSFWPQALQVFGRQLRRVALLVHILIGRGTEHCSTTTCNLHPPSEPSCGWHCWRCCTHERACVSQGYSTQGTVRVTACTEETGCDASTGAPVVRCGAVDVELISGVPSLLRWQPALSSQGSGLEACNNMKTRKAAALLPCW